MADVGGLLAEIVGEAHVLTGPAITEDYGHDEALGVAAQMPAAVVRPADADQVAAVVAAFDPQGILNPGTVFDPPEFHEEGEGK